MKGFIKLLVSINEPKEFQNSILFLNAFFHAKAVQAFLKYLKNNFWRSFDENRFGRKGVLY